MTNIEYLLLCFSTLFSLVNPLGFLPIFLALTDKYDKSQRITALKSGIITAMLTLIIFSILGTAIFTFFGITIEAFQIMGGIIFFKTGQRMLEGNIGKTRTSPIEEEENLEKDNIGISPLGIPIIAGPGAITATMVLTGKTGSNEHLVILIASIIFVLIVTYLTFLWGETLINKLGQTGSKIIQRIMGLLLMVIAIQFIITGSETVLYRILN
ncbi:MAG: NAAT family transporter [Candidatus Marinimicrobia bacterium]|nr:NAAT family transporter [Candidatus Neomarinimicrobiota bacterium]